MSLLVSSLQWCLRGVRTSQPGFTVLLCVERELNEALIKFVSKTGKVVIASSSMLIQFYENVDILPIKTSSKVCVCSNSAQNFYVFSVFQSWDGYKLHCACSQLNRNHPVTPLHLDLPFLTLERIAATIKLHAYS